MADPKDSLQEQLKLLCETYAARLPEEIKQIEEKWDELQHRGWNSGTLEILYRLTHNLTGSGATFGFRLLSDTARRLELHLKSMLESKAAPTAEAREKIGELLKALKQAAAIPDADLNSDSDKDKPHENIPVLAKDSSLSESSESSESSGASGEDRKLIFLVEDDQYLAQDLALQISYFGYNVRTFAQTTGLKEVVNQTPPAAIIMDIMLPEGSLAGPKIITEIQRDREEPIPVIFISSRNDLTARLQVVRAGGDAYFTKPVNIIGLINKLDILTARHTPEPYRILIVDDDAVLAAEYSLILRQSGMITSTIANPMQIVQPLVEFRPDLILMDVYMPDCNGIELAAAIRQQEAYVDIPIVFLSVETDRDKQLKAMGIGGDDFLTKPIQRQHLISAVSSRAERFRILHSFMTRDGLTGLLNHTKTKEQLELEVERAKRRNTQLAYAMIDIDHFKSVNDTHGHLSGDQALKSLALILRQRLRKTDIIGRYGGEEFAIILSDMDSADALKVLDEIRDRFSKIRQQSEKGVEFQVTFSCGVASFAAYAEAAKLNEAADKALYEAKRRGRNQVVLV
jgi:diguanylate cyclase (GGDEF)-like protein